MVKELLYPLHHETCVHVSVCRCKHRGPSLAHTHTHICMHSCACAHTHTSTHCRVTDQLAKPPSPPIHPLPSQRASVSHACGKYFNWMYFDAFTRVDRRSATFSRVVVTHTHTHLHNYVYMYTYTYVYSLSGNSVNPIRYTGWEHKSSRKEVPNEPRPLHTNRKHTGPNQSVLSL